MTNKYDKIIEFFRDTEEGQKLFTLFLYVSLFGIVTYILLFGFGVI